MSKISVPLVASMGVTIALLIFTFRHALPIVVALLMLGILTLAFRKLMEIKFYSIAFLLFTLILDRIRVLIVRFNVNSNEPALLKQPENQWIKTFVNSDAVYISLASLGLLATIIVAFDLIHKLEKINIAIRKIEENPPRGLVIPIPKPDVNYSDIDKITVKESEYDNADTNKSIN